MTPERWQEIKSLFHAVVDLDPAERSRSLDSSTTDPVLRAEVQALLRADSAPVARLDEPAVMHAWPLLDGNDTWSFEGEAPGNIVGAYRLVHELGRGGSGAVFLGVRDDEIQQRVAVKVLDRRLVGEGDLRRFERERRILASLNHPGIARLIDAGTTEHESPYLIMELVEGQPIDRYCDAQRLDVAARLRIVRAVCEAASHAHRNLVVHRDLKPGNILVTAEGQPKLLDFGIAKLLNPELSQQALHTTRPSSLPMTPLYASPEQIGGEPVTTASDVYSLGVVLYLLLTGERPYRLASRRLEDVGRAIREQEPEPPSVRVRRGAAAPETRDLAGLRDERSDSLARRLAGDLDAIVLKALDKSPARRYGSMEQLAADLDRYLGHRPVEARHGNVADRIGKLVRRNPLGALLSALVVVFAVAMTAQSVRLGHALEAARLGRASSERVTGFLVGLFEQVDPNRARGRDVTVREVFDIGARRLESDLLAEPALRAELLSTIGRIYERLQLNEQADSLLEGALAIRRQHFGDNHVAVADSIGDLAFLRLGQERFDEAEMLYRDAWARYRRLLGDQDPKVAVALHGLGEVYHQRGDLAAAEAFYRRALTLRREIFGEQHQAIGESLSELGMLVRDRGEPAQAEVLLREALAMQRKLLGNDNREVAVSLRELGMVLDDQEDPEAAEPLLREALAVSRRLLGDERSEVATTRNDLALVLMHKEDFAGAVDLLQTALETYERLLGAKHPSSITAMRNLTRALRGRGDFQAAEVVARRAFDSALAVWPEGHPKAAYAASDIGQTRLEQDDPAGAEVWMRRGLEMLRRVLGADAWQAAVLESRLSQALIGLDRRPEAETLLLASLETHRRVFGDDHSRTVRLRARLVALYEGWGRVDQAAPFR